MIMIMIMITDELLAAELGALLPLASGGPGRSLLNVHPVLSTLLISIYYILVSL